jgi:TonB-dependent SusC/RagA subfamily outer membrane receptor
MLEKRNIVRNLFEALFIYILLSSFIFSSGDDPRLTRIVNHLLKFRNEFPQQKVYMQLDKTVYTAGENIWFKAYLINAASQLSDTMSTNLYVELVNARNIRVQTHMLRIAKGFAFGDFILRDTVTEGNYLIKAYTGWMNNFDEGLIFKKNIYIKNSENANFISSDDIRFNKKFNRKRGKLNDNKDIQFLPEGGELIYGLPCRVAFKAVNGSGKGIDVEGKIKDNKGNEVASVHSIHLGMGAFAFKPEIGKTYEASVKLTGSEEMKVKLPQPLDHGINLFVDNVSSENFIKVMVRANLPPSLDEIVRDFILLGQTNGNPCFYGLFHFKSDSFALSIPKDKFPTGISQITIFNGRGVPVAERLVFINHHDGLNIDLNSSLDTVLSANLVSVKLKVYDKTGKPSAGNFSASFTDANMVADTADENNILNTFWLTSDIKGRVEKPNWYFDSSDPEKEMSLELLMMTQGWRRFDWKKILADQYPSIDFPEEKDIVITGTITRDFFGIPVKKAPVYLTILSSYNDYFSTVTDDKGRYKFGSLVYYDTMSVVVEASKPNGRKNVQILVDETQSPKASVQGGESFEQEVLVKGNKWKYGNVRRPDNGEKDRERKKKREKYAPSRIYGEPDNVIYMDDIPDSYTDLFQVMQGRVPGVSVDGNRVHIRGVNSLFGNTDPLYLVDGVPVDPATFQSINPKDVEMIEFLKGPSASIYGSRGSNGVIAAYTKRGDYMKRGFFDFKMLAYYTPREFYTTSVSSAAADHPAQKPETVYWKPEIKIGPSGEGTISFKVKEKVKLRIILEGISFSGMPAYAKKIINF